jgi:hypothetical protein
MALMLQDHSGEVLVILNVARVPEIDRPGNVWGPEPTFAWQRSALDAVSRHRATADRVILKPEVSGSISPSLLVRDRLSVREPRDPIRSGLPAVSVVPETSSAGARRQR